MRTPTTQKLKQQRDKRGFSQAQLAERAGIALRAYCYYESGERFPNVAVAGALAEALHTTVDELFFN